MDYSALPVAYPSMKDFPYWDNACYRDNVYPEKLVRFIKEEYPDWTEIHELLDSASVHVAGLLFEYKRRLRNRKGCNEAFYRTQGVAFYCWGISKQWKGKALKNVSDHFVHASEISN